MKEILIPRRHHCMRRAAIFLIVAALTAGVVGCGVPPSKDLEIRDWHDLHAVRDNRMGHHRLMNDLDSNTPGYAQLASETANQGKGWQPIGTSDNRFLGSFDGQGYEIRDMFINRPDEYYVGLFGFVSREKVIENLGVVNARVIGHGNVGILVGYGRGIVNSCYSTGSVSGSESVGGLIGCSYRCNVGNSYSTSSVTGDKKIGGLVGWNREAIMSNSYSTGSVIGAEHAGGLVGRDFYSIVSNSFWDTETSGQPDSDVGTGKTTAEMMDVDTYTAAGWDIALIQDYMDETWYIDNDNDYPRLGWQSVG